MSQTENERAHIASALVFELSKVTLPHIRLRVLSRLLNVDEELASRVAKGLPVELPKAAVPFREPMDLEPSDALSIQKNCPSELVIELQDCDQVGFEPSPQGVPQHCDHGVWKSG